MNNIGVLLVEPIKRIIYKKNNGVYELISNKNENGLKLLYKLYSCVPSTLLLICKIISKRIYDEGIELIVNNYKQKNTKLFVESLIKLYETHENIIINCFNNNPDFSKH